MGEVPGEAFTIVGNGDHARAIGRERGKCQSVFIPRSGALPNKWGKEIVLRHQIMLSLLALAAVGPAVASDGASTRTTTVFGDDACPAAKEGEIIVCGRLPESERYRIPKQFRKPPRDESGPSASWTSKVEGLEDAQRFTRPGSCTAVGTGGQSGCTQAMIRQWFLERRAAKQGVP